jgi:hypothetical protein
LITEHHKSKDEIGSSDDEITLPRPDEFMKIGGDRSGINSDNDLTPHKHKFP